MRYAEFETRFSARDHKLPGYVEVIASAGHGYFRTESRFYMHKTSIAPIAEVAEDFTLNFLGEDGVYHPACFAKRLLG